MTDLILDALLRPYSQLLIIAILVEIVLVYLVLTKCFRKDVRLSFSALIIATILAQLFAIESDSFNAIDLYSYVATILTFMAPTLLLILTFIYLHGKMSKVTKVMLTAIFIMSLACSFLLITNSPKSSGNSPNMMGVYGFIFLYLCIAFGGASSEIFFERNPENLLLYITVITSFVLWIFFLIGFFSEGALVFSQATGDDAASVAVMKPLFFMSFLYISFAIAIIKTNPIIIAPKDVKEPESEADTENHRRYNVIKPMQSLYLVQESRPKYSYFMFRRLSEMMANSLLLTKTQPDFISERYKIDKSRIVYISTLSGKKRVLGPTELNRIFMTISIFAERNPGSVILLDGLDYIFENDNNMDLLDMLFALKSKARETRSVIIIPLSLLISQEKLWVRVVKDKFLEAPELQETVPQVARDALGIASESVLDKVMANLGIQRDNIEFFSLPGIAKELSEIVSNLGIAEANVERTRTWKKSADYVSKSILSLMKMPWEAEDDQNV